MDLYIYPLLHTSSLHDAQLVKHRDNFTYIFTTVVLLQCVLKYNLWLFYFTSGITMNLCLLPIYQIQFRQ
jgi:hypothetical protein